MNPNSQTKQARLLRKAAYWLTDYASLFRTGHEPGPQAKQFAEKMRKLAADCRKASYATEGRS